MMAELQITQEYLGQGNHLVYLATMWKEFLESDTYAKGPGSTVAKVAIAMALIAQVAADLAAQGTNPPVFVSPNVAGIPADNNNRVYEEFERLLKR